ncbi:hypothetical protein ACOMHN_032529 [Nucella lapillus]
MKRVEIGDRVNNHYYCDHPIYSVCCERDRRFTCCEPNWTKNLREQLYLWGMLGVVMVVGATICACLLKDTDCIRSDNLQEVVGSFSRKFRIRKKRRDEEMEEGRTEEGRIQVLDTAPLTRNMAPLTTSTIATTSFIHDGRDG